MGTLSVAEHEAVATITMDDGKANAMDTDFFRDLDEALTSVSPDAAIVIAGRPGMFSAGLNTKIMAGLDADGMTDLLVAFGDTMLGVWGTPRPVVAAATGHALAGGTILAMCADHAVAAQGDFRWGLTETTIGFPMPQWILAIARGNVRVDRLDDLVLPGRMLEPDEAVEVGYADRTATADDVLGAAQTHAQQLAELPRAAYSYTKQQLRGEAITTAKANIRDDVAAAMRARST